MSFTYGEIVKFKEDAKEILRSYYGYPYDMVQSEDVIYVVHSGAINTIIVTAGSKMSVNSSFLISTGKTIDFGKHPFKEFYENKITPDSLPPHGLKDRLVMFLERECFYDLKHIHDLHFFWPNVDEESADFVVIWPNAKARLKGRSTRQQIKPGKFFKMLFANMSDKDVEALVEKFKETFAPIDTKVFSTSERQKIHEVYTKERCPDHNFDTCKYYKRLCDSCMSYERDHFETEYHPVEAFGSGDWTLFWAEDDKGRIGARVLSHFKDGKYQLGPIYATSKGAIDQLKKGLPENVTGVRDGDWEGARLLRLLDGDRFIGPYLDNAGTLNDNGSYLIVDRYGDIEHSHEGYYVNGGSYCDLCERQNGENTYISYTGTYVCDSCRNHRYFHSEYDGEFYPDEVESAEVYYNVYLYETWSLSQAENYAIWCEELNEYIKEDCGVETCYGEYIPKWLIGIDWLVCSEDGLAYPKDQTVEHNGEIYAKENVPEDSEYYRCNSTEDMIEGKVA